jgi:twitching motility two-component system response regulator PilG
VADKTYLRRPLTLKRVLKTLDRVTIEVLNCVPELIIDEEEAIDNEEIKVLEKSAKQTLPSEVKALVVDDSLPVRKTMEI